MLIRYLSIFLAVLGLAFVLTGARTVLAGEEIEGGTVMRLWEGDAPGSEGLKIEEKLTKENFVRNVTVPTVTVYQPKEKSNGAAVIICPGGGYGILAINHEGHDLARWFNTFGVTGIVLKYRLPRPDGHVFNHDVPLMDAQRAIRFVRSHAADWKIDPKRVGIMGFSAGGHLCSTAETHFAKPVGTPKDEIDKLDCRPDFAMPIYPVISFRDDIGHGGSKANLVGKNPPQELTDLYSNELQVTPQTPPTFIVQTTDDGVKVENSLAFYTALHKNKVPVEMHLYNAGGHGYGIRPSDKSIGTWKDRLYDWMHEMKFIPKDAVPTK